MLDQALLSMIGGGMQLRRNTIHAVVKLVLLVVFALTLVRYGATIIFTTWFVANVVSIVVVVLMIMRDHKVPAYQLLPEVSVLRGLHFDAFPAPQPEHVAAGGLLRDADRRQRHYRLGAGRLPVRGVVGGGVRVLHTVVAVLGALRLRCAGQHHASIWSSARRCATRCWSASPPTS